MQLSRFFFRASPLRALLEFVILTAIVGFFTPFLVSVVSYPIERLEYFLFVTIADALCVLWCVLRLNLSHFIWWRRLLWLLALFVCSCAWTPLVNIPVFFEMQKLFGESVYFNIPYIQVVFVLNSISMVFAFMSFYIGAKILLHWNRLRRRYLIWNFTHNQIMVLFLLLIFLFIMLIGVLVISRVNPVGDVLVVLLFLLVFCLFAMVPIVLILVFLAYMMVRDIIPRVQALASATSALRSGNYAIRVPVSGEDELGQLQTNFNAMAAELERVLHELQRERDTVSGLLQARRELVANVSHDLRTPVATLRGYLENTLTHWEDKNDLPPVTLRHDLQIMEDEVIRLQALVDDLFALARAEVGKLTFKCEPTNVVPLVRRLVEARAPLAWRTARVELIAMVPDDLPLSFLDGQRLEQVLQNLIHNGVRHTPPGGIVAVAASTEDSQLVLQVKDTGEGIDPADLPHIWKRFYQSQKSHARGGAGLGLALVQEWIHAMQGSATVVSASGEGTCFTLRLPLASTPTQETHISEHATMPLPLLIGTLR